MAFQTSSSEVVVQMTGWSQTSKGALKFAEFAEFASTQHVKIRCAHTCPLHAYAGPPSLCEGMDQANIRKSHSCPLRTLRTTLYIHRTLDMHKMMHRGNSLFLPLFSNPGQRQEGVSGLQGNYTVRTPVKDCETTGLSLLHSLNKPHSEGQFPLSNL